MTEATDPRVSVVIPVRNERRTLGACLDALAMQDHPPSRVEILLVDGCSTDGSLELAAERGVRILHDPGRGPGAARNVGIEAAQGHIVAFTDADCVPRFDWLTRIVARFEADPTLAGVAGAMRLPRGTIVGRFEDNDARLRYLGYITSNVAYRRDALVEIGGFDESLACAEDYDLAWRLLDRGHRIAHEPDAIVLHDPPETSSGVRVYLQKQFWYARHDVPAHVQALRRAWRATGPCAGSQLAGRGMIDALGSAGWTLASCGGLAARSGPVAGLALGAILASSAARVGQTLAEIGEGARDAPAMAALDVAKRLARGAGTLVGLGDAALAQRRRGAAGTAPLTRIAATPWVSSRWA